MTRTTLRTHEIGMIEREEFKVVFSGCRVVVCVKSENKKFEGYHGTTTLRFITYRLFTPARRLSDKYARYTLGLIFKATAYGTVSTLAFNHNS